MAEIKIEKKSPVWPWILLILVILGIIAYFVYQNQNNDDGTDDYNDDMTTHQTNDSIDRNLNNEDTYNTNSTTDPGGLEYNYYSVYEGSISDSTRIATDATYTKMALNNLTKVVIVKADNNNVEASTALQTLKNQTNDMTDVNRSKDDMVFNSENVKSRADDIVSVMESLQVKSFPSLQKEMGDLKMVASKINATTALDKQQSEMNAFFRKAKDILNIMNQ